MSRQQQKFTGIRAAVPADEDALIHICHRTFYGGPDFPYPELIGYRWAVWYIRYSFDSCFVAVDEVDKAVGYILCAQDSRHYAKSYNREIVPLIREACNRLKKTHPELFRKYKSAFLPLAGEYGWPLFRRVLRTYPAHLHIDLLPEYQKLGLGGKLMKMLLDRLMAEGVPGVHLVVGADNYNAVGFYKRYGFMILKVRNSSSGTDYIMGLKLNRVS